MQYNQVTYYAEVSDLKNTHFNLIDILVRSGFIIGSSLTALYLK